MPLIGIGVAARLIGCMGIAHYGVKMATYFY